MKRIFIFLLAIAVFANTEAVFAQKKKKKRKNETENTASQGEKILLRYNLLKGSTYTQSIGMDMNIEVMGMQIPQKQDMSLKVVVTDVASNGNQNHEATYEKIYMKQTSPMGEMEFDSENPAKQPAEFEQIKQLKGSKFTMIISPRGKVLETKSDRKMTESPTQNNNIEYPENPVGVGDSWTSETSAKTEAGEMKSKNSYKIISLSNGIAEVQINGKILIDNKEQGEISGTSKIDIKTGLTIESNLKQKLTMQTQGMDMKMDNAIKVITKM
ncbi:MAG: DUF6263 family protein [Raineya sp.]|nr:DUF6263 family protein [Raineya sp.]